MSTKKILAFSAIRSDYDLMSGIYQTINADPNMSLGIVVSGAHLSETFGYTVKYIEKDRLNIIARIENLLDSNSTASRIKSAAILLQSCIHTVRQFQPDALIYAGDREDVMAGALAGAYLQIPTLHFYGGDHSNDGNVDNAVRHAISKLSSIHFVSNSSNKERLLCLGEEERRIFVIGSPALDRLKNEPIIEKPLLMEKLGRSGWQEYALVIFHPILGCETKAGAYFTEILTALKLESIKAFISYPNVDAGNKQMIDVINRFRGDGNFHFYKNLERSLFVNLMRHSSFMLGNSSAGILEAPFLQLPAVNVGLRQKGRVAAENVIYVDQGIANIRAGIRKVLEPGFQESLSGIKSPYGEGNSVMKAYHLIKELNLVEYKLKCEDPLK